MLLTFSGALSSDALSFRCSSSFDLEFLCSLIYSVRTSCKYIFW